MMTVWEMGPRLLTVVAIAGWTDASTALAQAAPRYAVTAHLGAVQDAMAHAAPGSLGRRTMLADQPEVLGTVQDVLAGALDRLFARPPADAPADLEVEVELRIARLETRELGGQVVLECRVTLQPTGGRPASRTLRGRARVDRGRDDGLPSAVEGAAEELAGALEAGILDFPGVPELLESRGVLLPKPPLSRAPWVVFADLGAGAQKGGENTAPGALLRLGLSGEWMVVQLVTGLGRGGFRGLDRAKPSEYPSEVALETTFLGLEAGPLLRLGQRWELRLTGGAHRLWVTGRAGAGAQSTATTVGTASLIFQGTLRAARSPHPVRLGAEARQSFGTGVALPEFGRALPAVGFYAGLFVGYELPVGAPPSEVAP